jgi:hypothetical protein
LRGAIKNGMGRIWTCDAGEVICICLPQTNVVGLQNSLRDKFPVWASNGSCIEDMWQNVKDIIFEVIERFVSHKVLKQNPDPEYYKKEVKRL